MVKNPPTNAGRHEMWFDPWVRKIPLEKGMATHSSIFTWRIPGQRSLVGYSPWGCKELEAIEQLTLSLNLDQ